MPTIYVLKPIGVNGVLARKGEAVESEHVGDAAHVASLVKEGFFSTEAPKVEGAEEPAAEPEIPAVVSQAVVAPEEADKPKKR